MFCAFLQGGFFFKKFAIVTYGPSTTLMSPVKVHVVPAQPVGLSTTSGQNMVQLVPFFEGDFTRGMGLRLKEKYVFISEAKPGWQSTRSVTPQPQTPGDVLRGSNGHSSPAVQGTA